MSALREAVLGAIMTLRRERGIPIGTDEALAVLLPVVSAYGRGCAAATLTDVLAEECRNVHPAVRDAIADRIDALRAPTEEDN